MSERVLKNVCPRCGSTLILKRRLDWGCTSCQNSFITPETKTVYRQTVGIGIREYDRRKKTARMKYILSQHPDCTQADMRMRTGYGYVLVRNFYKDVKKIFVYAGVE